MSDKPVENLMVGNLPKLEDGCVIGSQKCYGETIMCDTCMMPLCEEHMSRSSHLMDCHYRLGLEKKGIKDMQKRHTEELKLKQEKEEQLIIDKVFHDTGELLSFEDITKRQQVIETETRYREQKEKDRIKTVEKSKVTETNG